MIIFLAPGGRLGNLLFQVAYLESIRRPRERIFATNLFGVHKMFCGLRRYYNTDFRPATRFFDKFVLPWLGRFLRFTRLVSTHLEIAHVSKRVKGWLPITFVDGYFQFSPSAVPPFLFRESTLNRARALLAQASGRRPVFVHVRRGDYVGFRIMGGEPLLTAHYYHQAISRLAATEPNLFFFVLGDSSQWCRESFADIGPHLISMLEPLEDLALMSLCEGGVVSNSTFAWWGARLCRQTLPIVGPRYWLGWPKKFWWPPKIKTDWMQYLEVES